MFRRWLSAAMVVAVGLSLTGCGAVPDGWLGWSVEDQQPGGPDISWPLIGQSPTHDGAAIIRVTRASPLPQSPLTLGAWPKDGVITAIGPSEFTAHDLGQLRRGQLLIANMSDEPKRPAKGVTTLSRFNGLDCAAFA